MTKTDAIKQRFNAGREARHLAGFILESTYSEEWFGPSSEDYIDYTQPQRDRIKAEYNKLLDRLKREAK